MIPRDDAIELMTDLARAFVAAVVLGVVMRVVSPLTSPAGPCVILFSVIGLSRAWRLGKIAPAMAAGYAVLVLLGAFGVAKMAPLIRLDAL
ncbi:hypothetical protein [Caulobacter sp. 17J80-11]|uniref:hypothetical protein n=1 Tax=Caulobacter sp. 17J80-11 TaxID=2763502 RepID=UPI001653C8B3|nr:hypothetical protein [Caulobacter sp. 17J80-11]MBC6981426.1 hypothetical protein [Caulobacter sp. 17J80-11]